MYKTDTTRMEVRKAMHLKISAKILVRQAWPELLTLFLVENQSDIEVIGQPMSVDSSSFCTVAIHRSPSSLVESVSDLPNPGYYQISRKDDLFCVLPVHPSGVVKYDRNAFARVLKVMEIDSNNCRVWMCDHLPEGMLFLPKPVMMTLQRDHTNSLLRREEACHMSMVEEMTGIFIIPYDEQIRLLARQLVNVVDNKEFIVAVAFFLEEFSWSDVLDIRSEDQTKGVILETQRRVFMSIFSSFHALVEQHFLPYFKATVADDFTEARLNELKGYFNEYAAPILMGNKWNALDVIDKTKLFELLFEKVFTKRQERNSQSGKKWTKKLHLIHY